jgi:hypothetical protein
MAVTGRKPREGLCVPGLSELVISELRERAAVIGLSLEAFCQWALQEKALEWRFRQTDENGEAGLDGGYRTQAT